MEKAYYVDYSKEEIKAFCELFIVCFDKYKKIPTLSFKYHTYFQVSVCVSCFYVSPFPFIHHYIHSSLLLAKSSLYSTYHVQGTILDTTEEDKDPCTKFLSPKLKA